MKKGTLYLCPTPLGNLKDITLRVLDVLREASLIAAEDTRRTRKLLSYYDLHTPLTSYHEHNKAAKTSQLIVKLLEGQTIAVVSDAGTPGIADPGEELVQAAIAQQITVIALPGPVAAITALTASGLTAVPFAFYGFLPTHGAERKVKLAQIMGEAKTVILYESPHRLCKTLAELCAIDPKRKVVVGRELTKLHEEYLRDTLEAMSAHFDRVKPRGEFTLLIAGAEPEAEEPTQDPLQLAEHYLEEGLSTREAARRAAEVTGCARNEIYRKIIEKKKSE
ncbi:MAG TPA: 16S rRNA (cytidine(1402)-2'-O)-methyltransferase [Oscillospiraceae bacterium]|nr:16S rRNA (cytidine(1402)-2'-O)-methyltransferase [Oscillospiraceae bacterium]